MPEGDTIARAARLLRDAIEGRCVTRVEIRRDPRGLRPPDAGTVVRRVEARGKHLLVHFGDGATLHTHLRMHGAWHVYGAGERWRRAAHRARAAIHVDDGRVAVCFDAPLVELRRADPGGRPTPAGRALARLGPDLCTAGVDLDAVLGRLARLAPATPIGDALSDQRVAAGVGNVFRCEVCWAHGVHPATPLGVLDPAVRRALYETAHAQLRANADRARRATHGGGLAVYGRHRRPCPRCRTPVVRTREGRDRRVTYWCPACQPPPPEHDPAASARP